jgi:hypothetical protein
MGGIDNNMIYGFLLGFSVGINLTILFVYRAGKKSEDKTQRSDKLGGGYGGDSPAIG